MVGTGLPEAAAVNEYDWPTVTDVPAGVVVTRGGRGTEAVLLSRENETFGMER